MDRYLIFLDTNNIISANYHISTPAFKEFFNNTHNQLLISEVCVDETIKNFKKKVEELNDDIQTNLNELKKLGYDVEYNVINEVNYNDKLQSDLKQFDAKVIKKDYADFDFIYNKSITLQKPFKTKNGKEAGGLRDNIMWSSYVEYLKSLEPLENTKIVFINNDSDFVDFTGKPKLSLNKDLLIDLKNIGIDNESIIVTKTFKSLIEDIIQPALPQLKVYNAVLKKSVENLLTGVVERYEADDLESRIQEQIENVMDDSSEPYITEFSRYNIHIPEGIKIFKDGTAYVYFTQTYLISFEYYLHKSDYYVEYDERNISVYDADWNEWVMLVGETWFTNIGFEVEIDISNQHNIEIIEDYMHDEINLYPEHKWDEIGLSEKGYK